jgi:hypothetical protein
MYSWRKGTLLVYLDLEYTIFSLDSLRTTLNKFCTFFLFVFDKLQTSHRHTSCFIFMPELLHF